MNDPEPTRVLKRGRFRTVLASVRNGEPVVIKRFHHPGWLQSLRDPGRARREHRALVALTARGVNVPAPLSLGRSSAGAEVHMSAIAGAVTLEQRLAPAEEAPGFARPNGLDELMTHLGHLVAALHASGVEHPDLHLGNVLVAADGSPWLIDFHSARIRKEPIKVVHQVRDLVALVACLREAMPEAARRCFLEGWREKSPARSHADASQIEGKARVLRLAAIEHGAGRWLRASSRCRVLRDEAGKLEIEATPPAAVVPAPSGEPIEHELPAESARRRWLNAARLVDHRIPVACPRTFRSSNGTARVVFDRRMGLRADSKEDAVRKFADLLTDRGLRILTLAPDVLLRGTDGLFVLDPPDELDALGQPAELGFNE